MIAGDEGREPGCVLASTAGNVRAPAIVTKGVCSCSDVMPHEVGLDMMAVEDGHIEVLSLNLMSIQYDRVSFVASKTKGDTSVTLGAPTRPPDTPPPTAI